MEVSDFFMSLQAVWMFPSQLTYVQWTAHELSRAPWTWNWRHSKLWAGLLFPVWVGEREKGWVKDKEEWKVESLQMVNLCKNFTPQKTQK